MTKIVNASCKRCHEELIIDINQKQAYCPYCGACLITDHKNIGLKEKRIKNLISKQHKNYQERKTLIPNADKSDLMETECYICAKNTWVDINRKEAYCVHCGGKIREKGQMITSLPEPVSTKTDLFSRFKKYIPFVIMGLCFLTLIIMAIADNNKKQLEEKLTYENFVEEAIVKETVELSEHTDPIAEITGISANNPEDIIMSCGDTVIIPYTITGKGDFGKDDICVNIDDEEIITVNDISISNQQDSAELEIEISAFHYGKTSLTVTDKYNKIKSPVINVIVYHITDLMIYEDEYSLETGETKTVSVILRPNDISEDEIHINVEDKSVLKIDDIMIKDTDNYSSEMTFTLKALQSSKTNVTVKSVYGAQRDTFLVDVREKPTERPKAEAAEKENRNDSNQTKEQYHQYYSGDTIVYITDNGKKYHLLGCWHISGRNTSAVTIEEAEAMGKDACEDCF